MGSLRLGDLANIKLKLNIATADTTQDAYLDTLNQQISFECEQFILGDNVVGLRTSGGPAIPDLVEYHDGGQDAIVLRRALSDVPATRDAVVLLEEGITLSQGTDYHIDAHPSRHIRRLAGVADNFRALFTAGCRNIKVTYTAETLDGKPDVARVVEEETATAFLLGNNDSTDGGGLVISQRSPDSGDSLTYRVDDFSPHSMRVLQMHREGQRFF